MRGVAEEVRRYYVTRSDVQGLVGPLKERLDKIDGAVSLAKWIVGILVIPLTGALLGPSIAVIASVCQNS